MGKSIKLACYMSIIFLVIFIIFPKNAYATETELEIADPSPEATAQVTVSTTSEPEPTESAIEQPTASPVSEYPIPYPTAVSIPEDASVSPCPDKLAEQEKHGKWKKRNKKMYYFMNNGKKMKGYGEIDGKIYYFDSKGVQHTGWQKIKGKYYFFRIKNGKAGFMVRDKKIDGVVLKKTGEAKLTKDSKSKLNVLIKANRIAEKATKPTMKKSIKLRKCFDYSIKKFKYRGSPIFYNTKHWDRAYALDMFDEEHGSCYSYAAALAYLANAIGCDRVYAVSSGGHGWTEINGKIYDIAWHMIDKRYSYYAMNPRLSGIDGRPKFTKSRKYVKKI